MSRKLLCCLCVPALFAFSNATAGPLTVLSQDWEQSMEGAVVFSFDADYFYGFDKVTKSGSPEITLSESWEHEGYSEAFSGEGLVFADYHSSLDEQVTIVASESGVHSSQLKTELFLNWDHEQFTNDTQHWELTFSVSGNVEIVLTEASSLAIALDVDFQNTVSADTGILLTSLVGLQNGDFEYITELSPSVNSTSGVQFIEAQKLRYLDLAAGRYEVHIQIDGRISYHDGSRIGGLFFSAGDLHSVVNLMFRDQSAPIPSPQLKIEPLSVGSRMNFRVSDLQFGQHYVLQASPDMSFADPEIVDYLIPRSLVEMIGVDTAEMGPQQFFRLVQLDD